jgi:hypothetical protein
MADPHDDGPRPHRDPWWLMVVGLVLLVLVLWFMLERSNSPEPGGVREGRGPAGGYSSDWAAWRARASTGAG